MDATLQILGSNAETMHIIPELLDKGQVVEVEGLRPYIVINEDDE